MVRFNYRFCVHSVYCTFASNQ